MRAFGISAIGAAALVLAAAVGRAADEAALTDEDRQDLAWFEGLGYPDVAGKPFVRVRPGTNYEVRGFLLEETDSRFTVLGLDLETWRFDRSPPGTADNGRVELEELRADDLALEWLHGGPPPTAPRDSFPKLDEPSVQVQVLFLAHVFQRQDARRNAEVVHGLLAHARTLRHQYWRHYPAPDDPSRPLRERAAMDLASVETFRAKMALVGFGLWGATVPHTREEQLEAFRTVLRRFPGSVDEKEVRRFAAVLERMVREAADCTGNAKPPEDMTPDERVDDLVFRLREETPWDFGAMGSPGPISGGPFAELVHIGHAAVPRLVEALADDSLTRYGGEGRSGLSPYVHTVGEVARMALERIAGRGFYVTGGPADVAGPVASRPAVEAWFAEVKAGRETDALERLVEQGDRQAAETLAQRDPAKARAALLRALDAVAEPWVRTDLLERLAKDPGAEGLDVIRREAVSGDAWSRLTAASLLAQAGDFAAPDALLALWRERRDGGGPSGSTANGGMFRERQDEMRTISGALLAMKREDLVRELADDLPRRSVTTRRVLAEELAKARPGAEGAWAAALEAALAQGLGDVAEYDDWMASQAPASGFGLRVRDVAAAALAKPRGLAAPSAEDPLWTRGEKVEHVATAWAREHGLPEPPREEPPRGVDVDAARVSALLDAIAASRYGADVRNAALRDLEALGAGAVPAIQEALAAKKLGYSADVETLAGKLAFVVRDVRVPQAIPDELRERLHALRGTPLTAAAFNDAVWTMVRTIGATPGGASLDACRTADAPGVVVTVTLQDSPPGDWALSPRALRGQRYVEAGGPGGCGGFPLKDDGRLARIAEESLAAPPGERAWLHVLLVRRPRER